jgi:glutamyl-tRNA synthetase
MAQFTQWFDLDHITPSAAQFNTEKLNWLNAHYLKQTDDAELTALVRTRLEKRGVTISDTPDLTRIVALYKGRVSNLNQLADEAEVFYLDLHPAQELLDTHLTHDVLPALKELAAGFATVEWQAPAIAALIKQVLANHSLKMPKLAMPARVMLVGQTHTPSVDAVISLFAREVVLARMGKYVG